MGKFCTACGEALTPGAAFCESCGKPTGPKVTPVVPATTATTAPAVEKPSPTPQPSFALPGKAPLDKSRLIKWAGIASGALVVGGGALYFVLRPAAPPEGSALAELLNANGALLTRQTCVDNFDYGKSPVYINTYDDGTRQLLDLLVKGKVYSGPQRVSRNRGFYSDEVFEYRHDQPSAVIRDKRLCFASKLVVDKVVYTPIDPAQSDSPQHGQVSFRYDKLPDWAETPEARKIFPEMLTLPRQMTIQIHHTEQGWQLGAGSSQKRAANASPANPGKAASSPSWLDRLSGLFSSNPAGKMTGVWQGELGFMPLQLDIEPERISLNGETTPVDYKAADKFVDVIERSSGERIARLALTGDDTLKFYRDGLSITLKRQR